MKTHKRFIALLMTSAIALSVAATLPAVAQNAPAGGGGESA